MLNSALPVLKKSAYFQPSSLGIYKTEISCLNFSFCYDFEMRFILF